MIFMNPNAIDMFLFMILTKQQQDAAAAFDFYGLFLMIKTNLV